MEHTCIYNFRDILFARMTDSTEEVYFCAQWRIQG